MNKPVINLQRYEVDELLISRDFTKNDHNKEALKLDAKVGTTDDNTQGAIKLSVSLIDKNIRKKLSATITGYFEINIEENIYQILYVNGTAILYPYLRSIVSIVSAIDSSEAMLLPTINVLELLAKSQNTDEE
jgi:preprotein translocase subunit secB